MLISIPNLLNPEQLTEVRQILDSADWQDGRLTVGTQAATVKRNRQMPEGSESLANIRAIVTQALGNNALFFSAALPLKLLPPFVNRYEGDENYYGNHIDNAMRSHPKGGFVRADLSATLFFSEPDEYDGGELVIEDTFGTQRIKLRAGSMVLYPGSSIHQVTPVTRGCRLASFMFIQSMIRSDTNRRILFEMDTAISALRQRHGESDELVRLTGSYHNLLRAWADS